MKLAGLAFEHILSTLESLFFHTFPLEDNMARTKRSAKLDTYSLSGSNPRSAVRSACDAITAALNRKVALALNLTFFH